MAEGDAGWSGVRVERGSQRHLDLIFWTFKPHRPNGHCGAMWRDAHNVTHASLSEGRVVVSSLTGKLDRDFSRLIRLSIGD